MSDVKHLPGCDQANPKLWDAPCNCAEIRAEGIRYAYMEWQDKTEWVQETATPSELGKHRADVMRERIAKAEAERDQLRADRDSHQRQCIAEMEKNRQLRAELEAIRGQQPVAWKVIGINPAHRHPHTRLESSANLAEGQAAHWKSRGCTVEVIPLYALPLQQPDAVSVPREELEALQRDKQLLDAIQDGCWDVRYNSSQIADTGDYDTGVEVIGHFMQAPHERILGEDFGADVRKAIAQAMTAEAYPPARPEYDKRGRPLRALLSTKNAEEV